MSADTKNPVPRRPPLRVVVPKPSSGVPQYMADAIGAIVTRLDQHNEDMASLGEAMIIGFTRIESRLAPGGEVEQRAAMRAEQSSGHALEEVKDAIDDLRDDVKEASAPFLDRATGAPLTRQELDAREERTRLVQQLAEAEKEHRQTKAELERIQKRASRWQDRGWQIAKPLLIGAAFALARVIEAWIRGHW